MAKKEKQLTYMQSPLPQGNDRASKSVKRYWSGLDKKNMIDTGGLSEEVNISTKEFPYISPFSLCEKSRSYSNAISVFGFDDILLVIYREPDGLFIDYIKVNEDGTFKDSFTSILKENATKDDDIPRCIIPFNLYDTPTDPASGDYHRMFLIFPDKKSMHYDITTENFEIEDLSVKIKKYNNGVAPYLPPESADKNAYYKNTNAADLNHIYRYVKYEENGEIKKGWRVSIPPVFPDIKYATVHLSRVFGVSDTRVYASGFNDYSNWNLDTIDEYNESNAWCSPAQANTKANGIFTGITNFQNHVICFKEKFMHEIYNNKNPFRIQDIYAEGTIDNRTIQDVDGKLIFFSDNNVKVYTGSNPRVIADNLNLDNISYAVSGTDNRNYYLYCENSEQRKAFYFIFDTLCNQWSEQRLDIAEYNTSYDFDTARVLGFAYANNNMFYLRKNGLFRISGDKYISEKTKTEVIKYPELGPNVEVTAKTKFNFPISWEFKTDLITNRTVDIKHIRQVQVMADIDKGSMIEIFLETENGTSTQVYSYKALKDQKNKIIRFKPRKTASAGFKIHFKGTGYSKLYHLETIIENGGELYG